MNALFQVRKLFPIAEFFAPRTLLVLLLCGTTCLTVTGAQPAFFYPKARPNLSQGTLTFAERVVYQRAIEDVYWRHRIWPNENPDPKPSLDAVMSQAQLEKKVTDYLQKSQTLEDYWQRPSTAEQLQAEMDRMARDTKQPGVLRELFEALGNDPAVIAECLARPTLAERFVADLSAQDQTRNVESPQIDSLRTISVATTLRQVVYTLPKIAGAGDPPCTDDAWTATTIADAPDRRSFHTAVWTGSEMIIWGGIFVGNTGGRYNPSTDSWTATSMTNAPSYRYGHTAVWTGSEMIVWGGVGGPFLNSGGRYNPSTDSWTTTSLANAPARRHLHTAVWTGGEMIVWGGTNSYIARIFNNGGIYNPRTDSWTDTSTTNAPTARYGHTAVWTGSKMIVWGGTGDFCCPLEITNSGGRYNPRTDSWTATSTTNAPSARPFHTAVWTGSEMIVWGVFHSSSSGGRYNPSTDSWTAISLTNAPSAREAHTAVWTGNEMIIWGGENAPHVVTNTGGKYNPSANTWIATSLTQAPTAREGHTAVWSGSEMIVWGGHAFSVYGDTTNTGGRYCAYAAPQLGNISTRAFVQTGDDVMIGGFIVQGTGPKRVIIRAIGPELAAPPYNVPRALANPTLELHDSTGELIASNNDWAMTIIGGIITANQVHEIQASGYAPGDQLESAIIADLPPGNYTAIVRGVNNMTGVALVEAYALSGGTASILGNISTRAFVQTGENVMIGGFIVQGTEARKIILRAIGPELIQHGIPNVLANPTLELHDGTGALIASNNNWATTIIGGIITANQVHEIQASGHAPRDGRESAIIADLPPGNYTAIVRGVNDTAGVGLVEVYDLRE